jgi:hypothetical protein
VTWKSLVLSQEADGKQEDFVVGYSPGYRPSMRLLLPYMMDSPEDEAKSAATVTVVESTGSFNDTKSDCPIQLPLLLTFLAVVDEWRCTSELKTDNNDN